MTPTYTRACPQCATIKSYTTKEGLAAAIKRNRPCKSCTVKTVYVNNPDKNKGANNPMFGKGCISVWKDTLSEPAFFERMQQYKAIKSEGSAGRKNPMFGKPAPKGAGFGISGTWNGIHFRSLLELQFIEWHILNYDCLPTSAERLEFVVKLPDGHNYFPDFITADNVIVEIKPKKLLSRNTLKISTARKMFGDKFIVMTEDDFIPGIETRISNFPGITFNGRKMKSKLYKKLISQCT